MGRRLVFLLALSMFSLAAPGGASAYRPLTPAIVADFSGADGPITMAHAKAAGVRDVIITLTWSTVAPKRPTNPTDPADPAYDWTSIDTPVQLAVSDGFTPIVRVVGTPPWAQQMASPPFAYAGRPRGPAFGNFMTAVATRFSGTYNGLPRVRYWECWNEPNLTLYLQQFDGPTAVSPTIYRDLLNRFYAAVHAVDPKNVVIAGMTAPFRDVYPPIRAQTADWGPLTFMRQLLCLSNSLKTTCHRAVHFDVWAHHPYTSGDPHHHAQLPDDVSLGDLPKMHATLLAAARVGHVLSTHPVQFWIDEFSWDSNPPDPAAVPMKLLRRWVAEGQYQAWSNGVSLFAWFSIADDPLTPTSFFQSGLYFNAPSAESQRPKPILEAFRFPTVAYRRPTGIYVWGRTPAARRASVSIEETFAGGWKRLGVARTDAHGIFQGTYRSSLHTGYIRATLRPTRESSVAFSLVAPPDHFYDPFGQVGCREKCGR